MMNLRRAAVGAASVFMMVGLGASGCNGDESTTGPSGSSTSTTGSAGGGGNGGAGGGDTGGAGGDGGMGGSGGGGGASAGTCPAEMMCLALKPVPEAESLPLAAGRVVVLWYQFNDDGPDPLPLIAYDAAFDPNQEEVQIPLADIAPPNEENMLCERACDDEAMCPCLSDLKVGTGYVSAVMDTDMSGDINVDELETGWSGIGYMAVGYSEQELVPAPSPLNTLFVEGIDKGTRPYRIIEAAEGVTHDDLGRTKAGDVLDLYVCPAVFPQCDLPSFNLT